MPTYKNKQSSKKGGVSTGGDAPLPQPTKASDADPAPKLDKYGMPMDMMGWNYDRYPMPGRNSVPMNGKPEWHEKKGIPSGV